MAALLLWILTAAGYCQATTADHYPDTPSPCYGAAMNQRSRSAPDNPVPVQNDTSTGSYSQAKSTAGQIDGNVTRANGIMAAGDVSIDFMDEQYIGLRNTCQQLEKLIPTAGFAEAGRREEDREDEQPPWDVVDAYTQLCDAIKDAMAWLDANWYTQLDTVPPNQWNDEASNRYAQVWTPAQTAPLRALYDVISSHTVVT